MTDDSTPIVYTNAVEIKTTQFDLQLHCYAQVSPLAFAECPTSCVIIMSPEHAQALVRALQTTLVEYQANCGALREGSGHA